MNWTLSNQTTRLLLKVSLAQGSDVALAQRVMLEAVRRNPDVSPFLLSAAGAPLAVSVEEGLVSIPALVDRPQFVLSTGPNEVRVDECQRCAAPLAQDVRRVVAENLVVLLGSPRVALYTHQAAEAVELRVVIRVPRFKSVPGEAALLDALAAAHSRALSQLSQDIATAVRKREESPR